MQVVQDFINQNSQIVFPILAVWSMVWKGLALWKAAKNNSKVWFVLMLVVNTVGTLEILYYFLLYKINFKQAWADLKAKFPHKA